MSETIVLADGDFPRCCKLQRKLLDAKMVICCDGAADKLLAFGRGPDWIVGDLDSVSDEIKSRFAERMVKFEEQDTNDLAKTFRFCRERGILPTAVLGAVGGREDHMLGNLSRFAEHAGYFPGCRLYTERGYFVACPGSGEFTVPPGTQISIFSFDPFQKITSCGLKFPLTELCLPWWHAGTLNEVIAETFTLTSSSNMPILVFFQYKTCNH